MFKWLSLFLLLCTVHLGHSEAPAVETTEEEGPLLHRFETQLDSLTLLRRRHLRQRMWAIDTMDISERKKKRLRKALYQGLQLRGTDTKYADTQFEDDGKH
ncbi:hypothetical protein [Maribacter sp. 2307ULW6-5]|uniref:hypothetical protein n=1 Tax=Maribacter sp. 2307ULW6-5 TaxID=3386275 RepID=UPI0039BD6145